MESINRAIAEEQAKAAKTQEPAAAIGKIPKDAERSSERRALDTEQVRELEKEIIDLRITNRGKDLFIEQLKSGYEAFAEERKEYVEKLMSFNRKVGELETKLLRLNEPAAGQPESNDGNRRF